MQVTMQHAERLTLAEMREFLDASSNLSFAGTGRKQIYGLLEGVLRSQKYLGLAKKDKGIVRRYLVKISGLSVAQITRLIARWRERGVIEPRTARRYRFPQRYTNDDILLLATTDGAHEGLSAPAIRRILQREFKVHGQANDERLASISASHIYNLRRTRIYREQRVHHTKTRASAVAIGERRKPEPRGRPGFLRVDAVHQGDSGSRKGIYHINAVDTVTQWQNVGCCETISEAHFIPVLEAILHQFPYRILGFHSDNGSEFINYQVEKLLNKLLVGEFTKSRANRTTDNALVEGKNGAVVRKHIGHAPIAARHAEALQRFYTADFNPYLNYHRPCGFATVELADNGKRRRRYRLEDYQHALRKVAFAQRLGELLEGRHQRAQPAATGAADERYRVRPADATTQKKTARRLPRREPNNEGHLEAYNSTEGRILIAPTRWSQNAWSRLLIPCPVSNLSHSTL